MFLDAGHLLYVMLLYLLHGVQRALWSWLSALPKSQLKFHTCLAEGHSLSPGGHDGWCGGNGGLGQDCVGRACCCVWCRCWCDCLDRCSRGGWSRCFGRCRCRCLLLLVHKVLLILSLVR